MIAIANGRRGILAGCVLLLLALTGCASGPNMSAAQSQMPPGMARVWILRQYRPMASQNMPMISVRSGQRQRKHSRLVRSSGQQASWRRLPRNGSASMTLGSRTGHLILKDHPECLPCRHLSPSRPTTGSSPAACNTLCASRLALA